MAVDEIEWVRVEVRKGRCVDEIGDRWFVIPYEADDTSIIMSDHRTYIGAMVEALSYGLPISLD